MSYLVLARKYRPQTFSEVIGQEHVTRTLQNAISRGRIHHAFLFCGGRGTGKTTTARILAKALSCVNAPTAEPCNQCDACVEITRGTSVDVQEIDAASQNRVEDIRELREAIRYAPVRGKKKLYILDEVHMLSSSAFNALLKTLEEPPPHAVFVFATTDPHKLPQTILSRVQRYDFKLVPTARLVEHLADVLGRESIPFERPALQLVAREGQGSVRDSLSLLDQVLASTEGTLTEQQAAAILGVADRALVLELGRAVTGRDPEAALQCIDRAYGRGYDLAQLGRALLSHLRDLVVVSVVKEPEALLEATGSELEELRRQAEAARGAAELLFSRMVRIADEVSRSPLARYVLEVGVCELCRVEPLMPVGELVDRLELLEGRIDLGGGLGGGPGGGGGGGGYGQGRPAPRPAPAPAPVRTAAPEPARAAPPEPPVAEARPAAPAPRSPEPAVRSPEPGAGSAVPAQGSPERSDLSPERSDRSPEPSYDSPESYRGSAEPPQAAAAPAPAPAATSQAAAVPPQAAPAPPQAAGVPAPAAAATSQAAAAPAPAAPAASAAPKAEPGGAPVAPASSDAAAPTLNGAAAPASGGAAAASNGTPAAQSGAPAPGPGAAAPAPPGLRPFTDLVKAVIGRAPTLSVLASGRPLRWDGERLQIGFPKLFELEQAQEKLPQIRRLLGEELGRPAAGDGSLLVEIIHTPGAAAAAPDAETLAEAEDRRRSEERLRRRQEALAHPARKQITEVFGEEVSFLEPVLE